MSRLGEGRSRKRSSLFPRRKRVSLPDAPEQLSKKPMISLRGMMIDQSQRVSDSKQNVDQFLMVVVTDSRLIEVPSFRNISKSNTLQTDRAG